MLVRSLCSRAGLPVRQGHLYLQVLQLFDRLKQLWLLGRREPACCPLPAALPHAVRVLWQEGGTDGVGFEFSAGKQRSLIPEVFETFSLFHISILKVDASSGFGYLWALLPAGASRDIATPCPAPTQSCSSRRRAGAPVERHWGYMTCV